MLEGLACGLDEFGRFCRVLAPLPSSAAEDGKGAVLGALWPFRGSCGKCKRG